MTDDELEAKPPTRPLSSRKPGTGRPPRMAKPVAGGPVQSGLKEITPEPPQPRVPGPPAEPGPEPEPPEVELDMTPDEPYEEQPLVEVELEVEPGLEVEPEPEPAALAEPAPAPEPAVEVAPEPDLPGTLRETLVAMDEAWRAFHGMAARYPAERMDEHLSEGGWTRKQMLAHIAAWHDHTADRLIGFINSGKPVQFDQDIDRFNSMVARRAIGKTAGEILNDTEATFNRLRRQIQRLSDSDLRAHEQWAAWVIRSNTYGHYEEHWPDVFIPEPPPGTSQRR